MLFNEVRIESVDARDCNGNVAKLSCLCLEKERRCDGTPSILNGLDEVGCPSTCNSSQIACDIGGRCIDASHLCSGARDCFDGQDERNCTHTNAKDSYFLM